MTRRFPRNPRTNSTPRKYGVLVGTVTDGRISSKSDHYEIRVQDDNDIDYRIAVNVLSDDGSEVMAHFDPKFVSQSQKLDLDKLAGSPGFTYLQTGPQGEGIDYLRDHLLTVKTMFKIPPDGAHGITLHNILDAQIRRAMAESDAKVIAFGEFFQDDREDDYFDFSPGRGLHDVHMMQGNPRGPHDHENRVNGDGGLFLRFSSGETVALFVRFESQAIYTDNETGKPN